MTAPAIRAGRNSPMQLQLKKYCVRPVKSFAQDIDIIGASRTDAGVHSYGNVAVFDVDTRIPAEKISYALNSRLPEDIRVVESRQVSENFHPRHVECRKLMNIKYGTINLKIL